jgi:hypothetical protein
MDCDKNNCPVNTQVPFSTHENLCAQSNVDKGRYFTVCIMLIVLLFISTVVMAISPAITMCSLSQYESTVSIQTDD